MDPATLAIISKVIDVAWMAYSAGREKEELNDEVKAKIDSGEIQTLDDLGAWLNAEYGEAATDAQDAINNARNS